MSEDPHRQRLCGRVVDVREIRSVRMITLAVGDAFHSVQLDPDLPAIVLGDIVEVELDGSRVRAATRFGGVSEGPWDAEGDPLRWRRPAVRPSRMELLWQRQTVVRALRDYFFEKGFLEVQTPLLVKGTCPDVHLDSVDAAGDYLVTSTEYQIKRMVAGGFEKLYTLTQNFRASDASDRHNPEFTMLEWARAFAALDDIEMDAESLVKRAFRALYPDGTALEHRGRRVEIDADWDRVTVRDALSRHLGMAVSSDFSLASMRAEVARTGIDVPPAFLEEPHGLLSYLLDALSHHLGAPRPTFLRDWPTFMTSSAQARNGAPAVAERSELFIAGIEVSDGFPSLRQARLQRELFERELRRREREGKTRVRIDERYVEALRLGLPPGAGMALGVDRLVMVLTGQDNIRNVIAFAWDEL